MWHHICWVLNLIDNKHVLYYNGKSMGEKQLSVQLSNVSFQVINAKDITSLIEVNFLSVQRSTGCSLNIVFFPNYLKYSGLCCPLVSVCVHTPGR